MKMNIKGLVFVGFAAAVFASAANAAGEEKTVTSLKYTEATYEKLGNKAQDLTATGTEAQTKYPSVAAVKTALETTSNSIGTGVLTVKRNGSSVGTFSANATDNTEINVTVPTTVAELTDHADYELVANKAETITGNEANTTKYPTTKAVADYVSTAVAAEANVQANWNETDATSDAYIQNKPTALSQFTDDLGDQKTANLSGNITTDSGSTTMYPSVKAVEDYVGTATSGQLVPTYGCTTYPCALVMTAAGTYGWEPIQQ